MSEILYCEICKKTDHTVAPCPYCNRTVCEECFEENRCCKGGLVADEKTNHEEGYRCDCGSWICLLCEGECDCGAGEKCTCDEVENDD